MKIKRFKFDSRTHRFTDEIEEIDLKEYVRIFCMRVYDYKINYIRKAQLYEYCVEHFGLKDDMKKILKADLLNMILKEMRTIGCQWNETDPKISRC